MVPFFESTEHRETAASGKPFSLVRRFWSMRSVMAGLFLVGSLGWGWHFASELVAARRDTTGLDARCAVARFIWPADSDPQSESESAAGVECEPDRHRQSSSTTIQQVAEQRLRNGSPDGAHEHNFNITAESADPFQFEPSTGSYTVRVSATGRSGVAAIDAPTTLPVQSIHASATIVGYRNSAALLNGQLVVKGTTFSVAGTEYRLVAVETGSVVVARDGDEFRINVEPVTRTASNPDSPAAVFR